MISPGLLAAVAAGGGAPAGGGGGGGGGPTSLTISDNGLIFRDQFNRSDRVVDGDNGWEESQAGVFDIVSNQVEGDDGTSGGGKWAGRDMGTDVIDFIVQVNISKGATSVPGAVGGIGVAPLPEYRVFTKGNDWRIAEAGVGDVASSSSTGTPNSNEPHTLRLVAEDDGGTGIDLRGYAARSISDLQDLSNDLDLKVSGNDDPHTEPGQYYGFGGGDGSASADILLDEFFLCGRNIVITGLGSGQKIQVDSRTAVVESGGSVEIDVDTWALPATTIKLLDTDDTVLDSVTPSGGIWGGCVGAAS